MSMRTLELVMHQVSQLTVAPYWFHERFRERGHVSFAEAQQELIFLNRIWPQICMQPASDCFVDASLRIVMGPEATSKLIDRLIAGFERWWQTEAEYAQRYLNKFPASAADVYTQPVWSISAVNITQSTLLELTERLRQRFQNLRCAVAVWKRVRSNPSLARRCFLNLRSDSFRSLQPNRL